MTERDDSNGPGPGSGSDSGSNSDIDNISGHRDPIGGNCNGSHHWGTDEAAKHLDDQEWLHHTAWYVLRKWDEVHAPADAIGHGRVLEVDEVEAVLQWL